MSALVILVTAAPAQAHDWVVSPGCTLNGNPYWYGAGPASGWHTSDDSPPNPGCHWWTYVKVQSSTPINTASRYLPINGNYNHFYIVHEWIPCAHSSTPSMRWRRFSNGTAGGYTTVTQTTSYYCDGYVNATNWTFNGSNGGYIQMVDNYPSSPAGIRVTADYLRYH